MVWVWALLMRGNGICRLHSTAYISRRKVTGLSWMECYATSEKENEYMSKMFGIILLVMVLLMAGCGKTTVEN